MTSEEMKNRYEEFKQYCMDNKIMFFRTRYFHLKKDYIKGNLRKNKFNTGRWSSYTVRGFCRVGLKLGDLVVAAHNNRACCYRWVKP